MDQHLEGVIRKINRAQAHMKALAKSVNHFRESDHYELITKTHDKGLRVRYTWDVVQGKAFPDWWPIRAGEILYQLHSALDHMAWKLAAIEAGHEKPDNVMFPIFKNIGEF